MSFEQAIHARAIHLDTMSLEMCAESGSGHPTSAMSIGHIVSVLMVLTDHLPRLERAERVPPLRQRRRGGKPPRVARLVG